MLKINTVTMEEKIIEILEKHEVSNWDLHKITGELLNLFSVSKRFEIDFEGAVLADIEITNNEPKIHRGVNGYGIGINPEKCKIKRVK